jgi:hypothetical protein
MISATLIPVAYGDAARVLTSNSRREVTALTPGRIYSFVASYILLYAYDLDAPAKRETALRLVEQAWLSPGETAFPGGAFVRR